MLTRLTIRTNKSAVRLALSTSAKPSVCRYFHEKSAAYSNVDPAFLTADGTPDYVKLILTSRVYDVCKETPMDEANGLSQRLGKRLLLKREDLQPVFSFKLRGAYNRMANLTDEERQKGVIACSAGNHAQGVAYSARHLGINATIVMPTATPSIKYSSVGRMGAQVVLHGQDFDEAKAECARLCLEDGLTDIPPFDDPYVIAGQGTIGLEILRQVDLKKLKAVFCTVGGGGLIAGIGSYIKRIAPHVKIIGVETYDADAMRRSLEAGERVCLKEVGLFADGAAVKIPGAETFRLAQKVVDDVVLCNTDEIAAAIKDVFEETRAVVEPSGALTVAGAKKYLSKVDGAEDDAYVAILSGANMNFSRLGFVTERAQLGEGTEVFSIVTIPERPGSFLELIKAVVPRAVTEFSYRISQDVYEHGRASVYMSFSVKDRDAELETVQGALRERDFEYIDISDNELAKSHARYMVGGKMRVPNERILSFEFPERPGALIKFLDGIQTKWNITLFHYRNNGSDIGKILAGISVPPEDNVQFEEFLASINYPYIEETDNVAYQLFLKG